MKVILYMAMSLNGIIAGENNEEDFFSDELWLDSIRILRQHGCFIWGRKTYEIVQSWPKEERDQFKGIKIIVLSKQKDYQVDSGIELVTSPLAAIDQAKELNFKTVVLTGGSTLNTSFAKLGLIDEVILNVEPIIEGQGIPLFHHDDFELKLELIEMKKSKGKTIQLHYKVVK